MRQALLGGRTHLAAAIVLLVAGVGLAGCADVPIDGFASEQDETDPGDGSETEADPDERASPGTEVEIAEPPYEVAYADEVSPVAAYDARGVFNELERGAPRDVRLHLEGEMDVLTDDGEIVQPDEATVTNLTSNITAERLILERATFSVVGPSVMIPADQPAARAPVYEGLRVRGYVQADEVNGSAVVEADRVHVREEITDAPGDREPPDSGEIGRMLEFEAPSRITVTDASGSQASGLAITWGNITPEALTLDGRSIDAPWEAWFTELDVHLPVTRGEDVEITGQAVQVFDEGDTVFDCRLVLDDTEDPALLGEVRVAGAGSAVNATLVADRGDGTREEVRLGVLDTELPGLERDQLVPNETYAIDRSQIPDGEAEVTGWTVEAENCRTDDRRS